MLEMLGYICIGLLEGLGQFLPVSASGISWLVCHLTGLQGYTPFMQALVHTGCLAALLIQTAKQVGHIYRELRIAALPLRRRKRQPDVPAVLDGRNLAIAIIPVVITVGACFFLLDLVDSLPFLTVFLVLTGILVLLPPYFPGGNRSSMTFRRSDTILMGIASGLCVLPGMSRLGAVLCCGRLRGCDRKYILDMALLVSIPTLLAMIAGELVLTVITGFAGISLFYLICGILAAAAAFAGSYGAVTLVRYLAVKIGYSGFAYFNFAMAMFCFILYLLT